MLKRTYFVFAGISLLLLVLVGCNNTEVALNEDTQYSYSTAMREEDIPTSKSIQQLTEEVIYDRYTEVENISFEDYDHIDNVSFLAFSFVNNQTQFFGFTVAEQDGDQWKLSWFEEFPIFQELPTTVFRWGGSYPGTEDRVIHITAGYVNNEAIEDIILYYPESIIKVIKLGKEQNVFFDIDLNSDSSLLKFECKSSDGKLIYQEDYSKT